jgi:hypothetical protein
MPVRPVHFDHPGPSCADMRASRHRSFRCPRCRPGRSGRHRRWVPQNLGPADRPSRVVGWHRTVGRTASVLCQPCPRCWRAPETGGVPAAGQVLQWVTTTVPAGCSFMEVSPMVAPPGPV